MKEYLTAEQIDAKTAHLDGIANTRAINKLYRAQDDSNLWPINGRFNATERAIRKPVSFNDHRARFMVWNTPICLMV